VRQSKPVFQNILDVGLRDVGVKNQPRRLAANFGKLTIPLLGLAFPGAIALCVIAGATGAHALVLATTALAWTAMVTALAVRMAKQSPMVVLKVTADGKNQATWVVLLIHV
jgi:hypothetical protein